MLVFSLFLVSSIGIFMNVPFRSASALDPHDCEGEWSEWVNSTECVMPNILGSLVHQLCPRPLSDRSSGLFVDFFKGLIVPWGERPRRRTKRPNPWKDINTECGGCSLEIRCRSRPPNFGCRPGFYSTLMVERASCSHSLNQPACQLPPRACAAINRTLTAYFQRPRDEDYLPDFICRKSYKGCVCCCKPFVPENGLCVPAPPPA